MMISTTYNNKEILKYITYQENKIIKNKLRFITSFKSLTK